MPVFSFEKIKNADTSLGPEMKSTGEVLGVSKNFSDAIVKAFIGTGIQVPKTRKCSYNCKGQRQRRNASTC